MSRLMTGRKTILVSILAMALLVAGAVTAYPQTADNPVPTPEAKKSGKMQPEPKPKTESKATDKATDEDKDTDTNKDTSVRLSHNFRGLGARFLLDQKEIWVSPAKLRFTDLGWIIPYGGVTSTLLLTDKDATRNISRVRSTVSRYDNISNPGISPILATPAGPLTFTYP